jgi:hypothetical protein
MLKVAPFKLTRQAENVSANRKHSSLLFKCDKIPHKTFELCAVFEKVKFKNYAFTTHWTSSKCSSP